VADGLIGEFGVEAYREARRRKRDATTHDLTAHWSRVALAIARMQGRPRRHRDTHGKDAKGRTESQDGVGPSSLLA
jgi:hypothetical protein